MANIISIIESNNMLEFDGEQMPIVCGNSNYIFKFIFDEMWSACLHKTMVLVVNGKRIAVDFEGDEVKVPVLPNAEYATVSLLSAETESEQLSSTALRLELISTPLLDEMAEFDGVKGYLQTVIGAVNNIESGNLSVKRAQVAENVSNPNLLINGDFKVNQRGKSNYNNSIEYTVDRWKNSGTTLLVNENSITVNSISSWNYLYQRVEDFQNLRGKTVTFTVKIKNISYDNANPVVSMNDGVSSTNSEKVMAPGIYSVTKTISNSATKLDCRAILNNQNGKPSYFSCEIEWAKLEIGSTSTSFCSKPYAEELALCQRYYEKIDTSQVGNKYQIYRIARSAYSLYSNQVEFGIEKRTVPTISLYSSSTDAKGYLYNQTKQVDQAFSIGYNTAKGFHIGNTNGDMVANDIISGYYEVDAEIY